MSSDDYGTVNIKRGDRTREIEILRQHYRRHRESLQGLIDDAPTEHLAEEYQKLVRDIDNSLGKLDEIEGRGVSAPLIPPPKVTQYDGDATQIDYEPPARPHNPWLVPVIIGIAVIAIAAIAWLAWKGSDDDDAPPVVVEETTAAPSTQAVETAPPPSALAVAPPSHDYGVIRKGTRATRQYEIANNGEEPITIEVARSTCRCLYYEHAPVIPPKGKESITVTIDGAKAKSGPLAESIRVTAKADPSVATSFDVAATIQ